MKYFRAAPVLAGLVAYTLTVLLFTVTVSEAASCPTKWVSTLTYNAGLTPMLSKYEERRLNVAKALKNISADFICLQEVWYERDVKVITDALKDEYPYHFSALHADVGKLREDKESSFWDDLVDKALPGADTQPCNVLLLAKLVGCLTLNCLKSENKQVCMSDKCEKPLYDLSQECRSCVSLSGSNVIQVMSLCANPTREFNRFNNPGLLVLSKYELRGNKYMNFLKNKDVLVERGVIKARVGEKKGVQCICTHLSALFPIYFEKKLPRYDSYMEQQTAEMLKIKKRFSRTPYVLLGDLNTGPTRNETGFPKLRGEIPAQYEKLMKMGYKNPYLENDGRCTYCSSTNPLIAHKSYGDKAIDFVLTYKVKSLESSVERVMDSGKSQLSDHYGVRVDVCPP